VGAYHSRGDIEAVFGASNVAIWADLDNDKDAGKIQARVDSVIARSEARVNSMFRRSRYTIPFDPVPTEINEICCYISGAKLYEPRSTEDISSDTPNMLKTFVMSNRRQAEKMIREILAGKLILDTTDEQDSEAPVIVRTDCLRMSPIPSTSELPFDRLEQDLNVNE
jgi:phage gp36-like protein